MTSIVNYREDQRHGMFWNKTTGTYAYLTEESYQIIEL
jgi:hypothetical protein